MPIDKHPVYDTDTHYIIDPISRAVTNSESKKILLMQNDHNSERFSFEIPRYVEGHDMSLCNEVTVHYINIDSSKRKKNEGVYDVKDMQSVNGSDDKLVFTWLISENATMYAGTLSFLILFACAENGRTLYRWNTNINSEIKIGSGINNDVTVTNPFPDILSQWRDEIWSVNFGYQAALQNGFVGSIEDWLASLKGEKGDTGIYVGDTEPNETGPYFWFDTSGNRLHGTIFQTNGVNCTVFIESDGKRYPIDNSTINKPVTSAIQYNFQLV